MELFMAEEAVPAQAAPETVATAPTVEAPVSGETTPEAQEAKAPRTFTQEELNAIVAREKAKARRSAEREFRQPQEVKPEVPPAPVKPVPESYRTTEEYVEALAEWKADQRIDAKLTEREKQQRDERVRASQAHAQAEYAKREEVFRTQVPDFDEVVYNEYVPFSDAMAATIQHSDKGPELAYHLGKNLQEVARIAQLPPFLQAKELGRIEAKLPAQAPRQSTAPEPIPAGKPNAARPVYETTDPRSTKQLVNGENATAWIEAERQRQRRKLEAQQR